MLTKLRDEWWRFCNRFRYNPRDRDQIADARAEIRRSGEWMMKMIDTDDPKIYAKEFDMIHRLRHSLRDLTAIIESKSKAMGYLARSGLDSTPLREETALSQHEGAWSKAALVVDAIASGGAAKLALATYGFKSDEEWATAMKKEFEELLIKAKEKE